MTGAEIVDIVTTIAGTVAILAKLRRYVTVDEYRAKISELHAKNNTLEIRVAVLEERARK